MIAWKRGDRCSVNVGGRTGNEWRDGEIAAVRGDGKLAILLPRKAGEHRRIVRTAKFVRKPKEDPAHAGA
jgi:hypothetical protein